jgi:hypothetical protein
MSLILGILAQSGGAATAASSYESIQTVTVGSGGSSSISFTSIPSTFTHLQIRLLAKWTYSGTDFTNLSIAFNTSTSYAYHSLRGNGATTVASSGTGSSFAYLQNFMPSGSANTFGASIIDILDYANTNKNKTVRGLGGFDANGRGQISLVSGGSFNTAAITSITITPDSDSFGEYSQFALYGIK